MEDRWLTRAKRLHAVAATGLHFSTDAFDRERYSEIAELAEAMLAELADVPIVRIAGLVSDRATGYATPKIDVRGALIENGRVLLVREQSDGLWTLPGGFADIGHSAAENVVKEMREEAGLDVSATRLYCVRHKAKHAYSPDVRDFYKLFFLCERRGDMAFTASSEISEAGFFPPGQLPPLSRGRVIEGDILAAFALHADPALPTVFD
ncbi:ADP-ribose pyrophosphatase YjhB, NUDIX family [Kaistia soli DSM 19436]|uniref:ADP-ribose pyrophosphatase YjhB, NUDIX family n=1 Tax=Kaistia soli DSM 19436 TaxID=1122133 RepID=A0A1M5FG86_9HYPH|nr:NUDIX hydrolase [Kaistia soli]SHF90504.1 ADP-ribose pyrophosphatase YjhB, NUDIX family [Kaistia soli DSM 19436]